MRINKTIVGLCLLMLLATSTALHAQTKSSPDTQTSCRNFVQGFYNWYLQKTLKPAAGQEGGGFELALKYKRAAFSAELYRLLKEDAEASAKSSDDIVGLDFDPFFNAQDMAKRYVADKVTPVGDRYRVEVYGISGGKKNKKPDVVPELIFKDGQWVFVNFIYGEGKDENLLSVLKELRKERQKPKQ